MASVPSSDFADFCDFVTHLRNEGSVDVTPEQSVQEFRLRQEQLQRWNERNAASMKQTAAGEAKELNFDDLMERVERRARDQRSVE
jgi:hypothetical protein